jgi:hypothetical protein
MPSAIEKRGDLMAQWAKYAVAALVGGLILSVGVGRGEPRRPLAANGTAKDIDRRGLAKRKDGFKVVVVTLKIDDQRVINAHVNKPDDWSISFSPDTGSDSPTFVCFAAKHHKHGSETSRRNHITLGIITASRYVDDRGPPTSGTITVTTTTGDLNPVDVPIDDTVVDPCDGMMAPTPQAPPKG